MWTSIVKKDAPSKPPTTVRAPAAILGMVGECKSTRGISVAVVDANAVIEGRQSLTNLADKFVTIPEVLDEIRDPTCRRCLDLMPFTIETMEPSPVSLSKVIKFAQDTGDFLSLSAVDLKLIALTYTLEAQVHGTKNLRDAPPPIQIVRAQRLPEKELPGWGLEWEAQENETEEKSNSNSNILGLEDLNLNILPSDNCSEVGSVVSHSEQDEQEGERTPKKPEVKLEGKMVVEGIDDDDEDAGDWRPAVSSSPHRKFFRGKAKWKNCNALAEQEFQRDLEADRAGNVTEDTTDQMLSGDADENCELSCEDDTEVEAEGIDVASEASSMADDGSSEQSWSLRALSEESSVACITGDFAMQNVILQMGLRLLAPEGMQIRQLNRWILRCHACYTVTRETDRIFCPKCGNGGTLRKVAVTIGENGTIVAARKQRIKIKGTKFPLPMPKSGRDAVSETIVFFLFLFLFYFLIL